jgi:hypothetical protein
VVGFAGRIAGSRFDGILRRVEDYSRCRPIRESDSGTETEEGPNMKEQHEVWDALVSLDSETLLRVITDYHGMQILSREGFIDHLVDEGLMIEDEDDGDEEAEAED